MPPSSAAQFSRISAERLFPNSSAAPRHGSMNNTG
jgi:hypothetical protein